jgi:hypothetical protein
LLELVTGNNVYKPWLRVAVARCTKRGRKHGVDNLSADWVRFKRSDGSPLVDYRLKCFRCTTHDATYLYFCCLKTKKVDAARLHRLLN